METIKLAASRAQSMACGAAKRTGHSSPLVTDCLACPAVAIWHGISTGTCAKVRAACLLRRVSVERVIGPPSRDMGPIPSQWNVSSKVISGRWTRSAVAPQNSSSADMVASLPSLRTRTAPLVTISIRCMSHDYDDGQKRLEAGRHALLADDQASEDCLWSHHHVAHGRQPDVDPP